MMIFSDELSRDWRSDATDDLGLVIGGAPTPPHPDCCADAVAAAALPLCLTTVDAATTAVAEADDTKSHPPPVGFRRWLCRNDASELRTTVR